MKTWIITARDVGYGRPPISISAKTAKVTDGNLCFFNEAGEAVAMWAPGCWESYIESGQANESQPVANAA